MYQSFSSNPPSLFEIKYEPISFASSQSTVISKESLQFFFHPSKFLYKQYLSTLIVSESIPNLATITFIEFHSSNCHWNHSIDLHDKLSLDCNHVFPFKLGVGLIDDVRNWTVVAAGLAQITRPYRGGDPILKLDTRRWRRHCLRTRLSPIVLLARTAYPHILCWMYLADWQSIGVRWTNRILSLLLFLLFLFQSFSPRRLGHRKETSGLISFEYSFNTVVSPFSLFYGSGSCLLLKI